MKFNLRMSIRIAIVLVLLFFLYRSGLPIYFVVLFGIIIFLLIALRGKLYKKIDHLLKKHFKFMAGLKPWQEKLVIILVFIVVYVALRELIYFVLGLFGINLQGMIEQSFNHSANLTG